MKLKYFDLAKRLSYKSNHHKVQMGCVIVDKNRVIGLGINQMKTNPKSPYPYKTTHCEFDAVLDCERRSIKGASIYIYRENKSGTLANAKPCRYCEYLLRRVGIKRVYFTNNGSYECMNVM